MNANINIGTQRIDSEVINKVFLSNRKRCIMQTVIFKSSNKLGCGTI